MKEANGFSGTGKVLWDDTGMYILAEIIDPAPSSVKVDNGNGAAINLDSIEIWVSEANNESHAYIGEDFGVQIGTDNITGSALWCNNGIGATRVKSSAVVMGDGKYTIEAEIPFKAITPAEDTVISFNISANDDNNNDGVRDTLISWVDPAGEYWIKTIGTATEDSGVFMYTAVLGISSLILLTVFIYRRKIRIASK